MIFLHNITKIALKSVILYVHFTTRTPLILLFYGVTLMGLFGGTTPLSLCCFSIFIGTTVLILFLVVLFNTNSVKHKATLFVGKDFCSKYLSHSAPATKSFARAVAPTVLLYGYNSVSAELRDSAHHRVVNTSEQDIRFWEEKKNHRNAYMSHNTLNRLQSNYQYAGSIDLAIARARDAETTQSFYKYVAYAGSYIFGPKK